MISEETKPATRQQKNEASKQTPLPVGFGYQTPRCCLHVPVNGEMKRRREAKMSDEKRGGSCRAQSVLVSTKHETGRWLDKEIPVLETIFF